jgi:hypothetical protein
VGRRITAQGVHYATKAGLGRTATEPTEETWDERQARVNEERAARRAEREAEAKTD